jgi:hypothetical protein
VTPASIRGRYDFAVDRSWSCRDGRGCVRGSSGPWYAPRRPWRSLLSGRSLGGRSENPTRRLLSDYGMPQRVLSLLALAAVLGCRHPTVHRGDEWASWFDRQARQLARWDGSAGPEPDGPTVRTPDGLSVRLRHNFRKRNEYGCWDSGRETWRTAGWRDVCVSRIVPETDLGPRFFLRPEPLDPAIADQHQSERWEVGLVTIDGRRAIVERARVSGGIEGAKRERRTAILIELPSGGWAFLEGAAGDDLGYAELLGIAGTIRSP